MGELGSAGMTTAAGGARPEEDGVKEEGGPEVRYHLMGDVFKKQSVDKLQEQKIFKIYSIVRVVSNSVRTEAVKPGRL